MRWFWQRKRYEGVKIHRVNPRKIAQTVERLESYGKDLCLDIGECQESSTYQTVDIRLGADYVGDVMAIISPDVPEKDGYDLTRIPSGHFKLVRMRHFIEHIPWLYHRRLFEWVKDLLMDGGVCFVDTPNMEYITKMYLANLERQRKGLSVNFPAGEHPDLRPSISRPEDMQRWVNFKLYSGGSPGDNHKALYDSFLLNALMSEYFSDVIIAEGTSIYGMGMKAYDETQTTDFIVRSVLDVKLEDEPEEKGGVSDGLEDTDDEESDA